MWRSAEELRKPKEINGYSACAQCEIRAAERAGVYRSRVQQLGLRDCEPKCNIQKQANMRQPQHKQVLKKYLLCKQEKQNENVQKRLFQNSPPLITHTAATPQDSPSTTLDEFPEFRYSISSDILPDMGLNISISEETPLRSSIDSVPNTSVSKIFTYHNFRAIFRIHTSKQIFLLYFLT